MLYAWQSIGFLVEYHRFRFDKPYPYFFDPYLAKYGASQEIHIFEKF